MPFNQVFLRHGEKFSEEMGLKKKIKTTKEKTAIAWSKKSTSLMKSHHRYKIPKSLWNEMKKKEIIAGGVGVGGWNEEVGLGSLYLDP